MSRTAARLMCAAAGLAPPSPSTRSGAVARSSATLVRRERALSTSALSSLARASVGPATAGQPESSIQALSSSRCSGAIGPADHCQADVSDGTRGSHGGRGSFGDFKCRD